MGSQKPENNTTTSVTPKLVTKPYGKIELSLNNVLLPEEKVLNTPSRVDGLDFETETDLRILGCELIQTAGILLRLPQVAMATGQVLFQRFYYSKSFVRCPMETTAMSCVCLASKIEEAPRRIRDVINVFHHIRQVQAQKPITSMVLDQHYITLKTQVIKAERRVLKELGFCVHVKHPHKIIVVFLQVLGFEKHTDFLQMSWNYMNDALRCDVFMKYDPETVACACIYLSARRLKITLPRTPILWFSLFHAKESDLIAISKRIVRLYTRPKKNIDELEKKVDELRKAYQDARMKVHGGIISGNNTPTSNSPVRNNNHTAEKPRSESRSRSKTKSRSRSRSTSRSPAKQKRLKKSRGRSRTPDRRNSKKHRSKRSYSASPSPSRNHTKRSREKTRYRSRSRSPVEIKSRSSSYDKYYNSDKKSSKSKHRESYEDTRIRSRH